ncbi:MAG: DUF2167 domain-containing protein [Prosthecobacter sp.]
MKRLLLPHVALLACLAVFSPATAQQPATPPGGAPVQLTREQEEAEMKKVLAEVESYGWTRQGIGRLGDKAEIDIPQGYRFSNGDGARKLKQFFGNPPSQREQGVLTTEGIGHWILFEFDESGYVKDDEKDEIDADKLLKQMSEGQAAANQQRQEMGMDALVLEGWAVPPRYNAKTNNLEWALRVRSVPDGGISVNYNTKLLGRKGVMSAKLICGPEELQALLPEYEKIIAGFRYIEGERYAEFRSGDKVAKYGLTALIAGTGAFAAAKMGLFAHVAAFFAKLGKAAILLVIGALAAVKKLFSKIFGGRQQPPNV